MENTDNRKTVPQPSENGHATMQPASRRSLSPNVLTAEKTVDRLKRMYPTVKDFMLANSPDCQTEVCADPDGCHFGGSPTLSQLNACYGGTAA